MSSDEFGVKGRGRGKGKQRKKNQRLQQASGHFQDDWMDDDHTSEKGSDPGTQDTQDTKSEKGSVTTLSTEKGTIDDLVNQMASYHISFEDAMESNKPFRYVMSGNGIYRIEVNEIGTFLTKSDSVPGLRNVQPGFRLKLPAKVPYVSFLQILAFFRDVCDQKNQAEAMVQVFWNREKQEYFVFKPIQIVSKASVHFKRNLELEEEHLLVADIHSHNTMNGYFSSVDDRDEKQQTRVYGVIGKVTSKTPEWKFRVSCGGAFHEIDMFDIFENPFGEVEYPQEWLDNLIMESSVVTMPGVHTSAGFVPAPNGASSSGLGPAASGNVATRITTAGGTASHGPTGLGGWRPVGIRSTADPTHPPEDQTYPTGYSTSGGSGTGSFFDTEIDLERMYGGYMDTSDHLATIDQATVPNQNRDPEMADDAHVVEIIEELLEYNYGPLIKEMLNDWGDSHRFYPEYYEKRYLTTSPTYPVMKVVPMVERILSTGNSVTVAVTIKAWEESKAIEPKAPIS